MFGFGARLIGGEAAAAAEAAAEGGAGGAGAEGRGLHSSTFQLNVRAFCGVGLHVAVFKGVFRSCAGGSYGILGGV